MEEESPLENRLRNLYALQQIDRHLDELEELKGDLPGEVRTLEQQYSDAVGRRTTLEETMRGAFMARDQADSDIIGLKEKLERYKSQQLSVRTNREYDALTREMDAATDSIARLEKEMESHETRATTARTDIEGMAQEITGVEAALAEKRAALTEVAKANEEEELRYRHEREKIVARITRANRSDLDIYERIRRAKKGTAVVPVRRGACGGCFHRVPPQRVLELRQNTRMHTCERCGRILVSDEIAESTTADV